MALVQGLQERLSAEFSWIRQVVVVKPDRLPEHKTLEIHPESSYNSPLGRQYYGGGSAMEEAIKLMLTPQQTAEIKKQIGFELQEIYLTRRSLNKLRVFRLRLNEDQQQLLDEKLGQRVKELTVTRSVATRIL